VQAKKGKKMAEEIELKLSVPARAVKRLLKHPLLQGRRRQQHLCNVYFDTPELALREAHVALRQRRVGRRCLQTVKAGDAMAGGLAHRGEWEGPIEQGKFDFSAIDDKAVRQRLKNCRQQLKPLFTTDYSRVTWQFGGSSRTAIELALDRGTIESQGRRTKICELELELRQGEPAALFELARELQQTLPLQPAATTKDERGYALWLDQPLPPVKATLPALDPDQSIAQAFVCVAQVCLQQLQQNQERLLESDDAEYLHQMRVALRRLRAGLQLFKPALPASFLEHWQPIWRDLGRQLGKARDWDVFATQMLPPLAAALPGQAEIQLLSRASEHQRALCRQTLRAVIRDDAHASLMLDFSAALFAPPFVDSPDKAPDVPAAGDLKNFARRRLKRQARRATALAARVSELDAGQRHQMRIAFKKLRYALEFFARFLPARRLKPYHQKLTALQDALGELNDLQGAAALLTRVGKADGVAGAWFAARHEVLLELLPEKVDRFLDTRTPWR
jgi:triphosphatase